MKQLAFIGGSNSFGIGVYIFENGKFEKISNSAELNNPMYICKHDEHVYSVLETAEHDGKYGGGVAAFINKNSHLAMQNSVCAGGISPCHITYSHKYKLVFTANYFEGSITAVNVNDDGSLGEILLHHKHTALSQLLPQMHAERQEAPHAHCVCISPSGETLCVVDLGLDSIFGYDIASLKSGKVAPKFQSIFPAGTGPRHMVFSKCGQYAFVNGELSSEIFSLTFDEQSGFTIESVHLMGDVSTTFNTSAAVKLSSDGKFLYVSNRGFNSINVFAVTDANLQPIQVISCGGVSPRDITIDNEQRYVLAANEVSNNVAILARDTETGMLAATGESLEFSGPTCVLFE